MEESGGVVKDNGNRKKASERIAEMRALEARRRRRRRWLAGAGALDVVAAAATGITLAATGGGTPAASGGAPQPKLASLSTLGKLTPAPSPGPTGPEGVPVPSATPLAGTATITKGQAVDGISCQTS
jgi:hypothetical protein